MPPKGPHKPGAGPAYYDVKQRLLKQIGDAHLPFFTPEDERCNELWKTKYEKLVLHEAQHTPAELHNRVQKAFLTLLEYGCLFQDLVRLKSKDLLTSVSRILIGEPGCTYRYLNTRLFAIPWSDNEHEVTYDTQKIADACKAFYELNTFMYEQTKLLLQKCVKNTKDSSVSPKQVPSESNVPSNNVTLINYLNPQDIPYLRDEPYFGMGKMAVSWHHDENLLEQSTVAVYNYSFQDTAAERVTSNWHVGLKIAWDIDTPGLALPLNSGDAYFMLGDMNKTHQHCVITGSQPRFSSTHRAVECSKGTLKYIQERCKMSLLNLHVGKKKLNSLEKNILKQAEEIHNEVEFEWLCQYWFQGKRYAKFCDFWVKPLADLEEEWRQMEMMNKIVSFAPTVKSINLGYSTLQKTRYSRSYPDISHFISNLCIWINKNSKVYFYHFDKQHSLPNNFVYISLKQSLLTSLFLEDLRKDTWKHEDRYKIVESVFPLLEERQQLRQEWKCR
ncbi:alpha-ketoglutarate-dependent dioxygenase FTO [Gastrophryne carolinensis]